MTHKQITDGIRVHRDSLVLIGLILNLGAVLVTSGVIYGRISTTLDRAVSDLAELRREVREEERARIEGDRRIEDLLRRTVPAVARVVSAAF